MSILIVGASRGIGLELTRQLAQRGAPVVATCRAPSPALDSLGVEVFSGLDVRDSEALERLRDSLGQQTLSRLWINAGVLRRQSLEEMDWAAIQEQFEVNAMGPLRVAHALLPRLGEGSRVAIVSSRMGSLSDNSSGGHYGYRMSKAAVNMAAVSLARDLAPRGIAVGILHPGFVRTDMTGGRGMVDAPEAARGMIQRMEELDLARSGTFWHAQGQQLPW